MFGTILYRKLVIITNEDTEIVVTQQKIDFKAEAKRQFQIAAVDSLNHVKKSAKYSINCEIDDLVDHFGNHGDSKLSA